jgi:hypothetical protein
MDMEEQISNLVSPSLCWFKILGSHCYAELGIWFWGELLAVIYVCGILAAI